MRRSVTRANTGDGNYVVTVRYESEACIQDSVEARKEQIRLLRDLGNNSDLHNCDTYPFQSLKMFHDGMRWQVELEALSN